MISQRSSSLLPPEHLLPTTTPKRNHAFDRGPASRSKRALSSADPLLFCPRVSPSRLVIPLQMADAPLSLPAPHQDRGGRRRGRGGGRQSGPGERGQRSRGRGGRVRGQNRNAGVPSDGPGQAPSSPAAGEGKVKRIAVETGEAADDGEICFICASRVEHTSVSPCDHRTCHICALRLRALYKNKACAHCRVCYGLPCSRTSANICRLDRVQLCDLHR